MHRSEALSAPTQRSIARGEDEYTVPEAAALLEVGERYVWYRVKRGELASFKKLGRRLIRDADLKAYAAQVNAGVSA